MRPYPARWTRRPYRPTAMATAGAVPSATAARPSESSRWVSRTENPAAAGRAGSSVLTGRWSALLARQGIAGPQGLDSLSDPEWEDDEADQAYLEAIFGE